jgi:hypothetical protein
VAPLLETNNMVGGTKSERNAQESTKQKAKVNSGLNLPAEGAVQLLRGRPIDAMGGLLRDRA